MVGSREMSPSGGIIQNMIFFWYPVNKGIFPGVRHPLIDQTGIENMFESLC